MLRIRYQSRFKRDYKTMLKRGCNPKKVEDIINLLANETPLPEQNKDHALTGNWTGFRECHIEPDWLLIYKIDNDILTLTLARTGTHSDLF